MSDPRKSDEDAAGARERTTLGQKALKEAREWVGTLAVFVPLFYLFSLFLFEQRVIPSESMVPNLQVGDRVAVNKFAYGYSRYSLPWGAWRLLPEGDGRLFASEPERGDVVVFMHPHTPRVMIKRLIGLPGDSVRMVNEQLFINGERVGRDLKRRIRYVPHDRSIPVTAREYREALDGADWLAHEIDTGRPLDTTPEFLVPEGHFLFIGDNRDNSEDGRAQSGHCPVSAGGVIDEAGCPPRPGVSDTAASIGFVPFENLIGRAETVLFTTYSCGRANAEPCMKDRLWGGL